MVYKLFIETGNYTDNATGEDRNLLSCLSAISPEGINIGWTEFASEELAMEHFNISKKVAQ